MNQTYINTLVSLIRRGVINPKTGQPFTLLDILIEDYRTAVESALSQ